MNARLLRGVTMAQTLANIVTRALLALVASVLTPTIPIVMASAGDPVATGLVASLERPGGNVTGISNIAAELSGERFELLRELLPSLTRVGLLVHGGDTLDKAFVEGTQRAASSAGIQLHVATVPRPEDLDGALSGMTKGRVGAVIVPANLPVPGHQVALSAQRHRLPSISLLSHFPESGGLMSYGASLIDIRRRAVGYVDKILKGAEASRPARGAAHDVRARDQSQGRAGPRAVGATLAAAARGSGDRMSRAPSARVS
jgi:ABC-type uncharacterized transport system substrate-binding protein